MEIKRQIAKSPTNDQIRNLAKLIIQANDVALKVSNPSEDGGTCNLDAVLIDFAGWRETQMQLLRELLQESKISVGDKMRSGYFINCARIGIHHKGQGDNRARMVMAAVVFLRKNDVDAHYWAQMD